MFLFKFPLKNAENPKTHTMPEGDGKPPEALSFGDVFFHEKEKATTI